MNLLNEAVLGKKTYDFILKQSPLPITKKNETVEVSVGQIAINSSLARDKILGDVNKNERKKMLLKIFRAMLNCTVPAAEKEQNK